mmetsp:Transcript_38333/g.62099  ORF Transcript_38333/g.62099 Transcript_38333/m.62099 type:complete len:139 (+) Transcript_38333:51-467(+)
MAKASRRKASSFEHRKPPLTELALESARTALIRRRQVDLKRVAAFIKRFMTLALSVHTETALRCLSLVQELLRKYPKLQILLDSDSITSEGVYRFDIDEPEHCSALSSTLWELVLLRIHYNPSVAKLSTQLAQSDKQE